MTDQPDLDFTPMSVRIDKIIRGDEPQKCAEKHTTENSWTPQAHARRTDPPQSHEAAKRAGTKTAQVRAAIEIVFRESGPMTDEELIRKYRERNLSPSASDSGIRTRRKELANLGKLRISGDSQTQAGNPCRVWEIVKS